MTEQIVYLRDEVRELKDRLEAFNLIASSQEHLIRCMKLGLSCEDAIEKVEEAKNKLWIITQGMG